MNYSALVAVETPMNLGTVNNLFGAYLNNFGTINNNPVIDLSLAAINNAGTFTNASGANVSDQLTNLAGGYVINYGTLTNNSLFASVVNNFGTLANYGNIVSGYGRTTNASGANLVNYGNIDVPHSFGGLFNSGTLTNYFNIGGYNIVNAPGGDLRNYGVIGNDGFLDLTNEGKITNNGTIINTTGFGLTNSGTIVNRGQIITNSVGSVGLFSNSGTITNSGEITNSGRFSNSGYVAITNSGLFATSTNYTQTGGGTLVNGTLSATGSAIVDIQGGTLGGTGTINGNVAMGGTITPGDPGTPGALTIFGNYEQTGTGTFEELIGPLSHSFLDVSGNVSLDSGAFLDITLLNGYDPLNQTSKTSPICGETMLHQIWLLRRYGSERAIFGSTSCLGSVKRHRTV